MYSKYIRIIKLTILIYILLPSSIILANDITNNTINPKIGIEISILGRQIDKAVLTIDTPKNYTKSNIMIPLPFKIQNTMSSYDYMILSSNIKDNSVIYIENIAAGRVKEIELNLTDTDLNNYLLTGNNLQDKLKFDYTINDLFREDLNYIDDFNAKFDKVVTIDSLTETVAKKPSYPISLTHDNNCFYLDFSIQQTIYSYIIVISDLFLAAIYLTLKYQTKFPFDNKIIYFITILLILLCYIICFYFKLNYTSPNSLTCFIVLENVYYLLARKNKPLHTKVNIGKNPTKLKKIM